MSSKILRQTIATLILTALALLLAGLAKDIQAGGKGKVPIYMPVPIPIPMPMGPSGGGGKFFHHHHHQQQQHDGGEGEVKKIYLLQPMPKVQPQPQLKGGGFMGPVQTHIHMPPPFQNNNKGQHPLKGGHSLSAYEDEQLPTRHTAGKSSGNTDMKILPIVVIPPIAPMPPIQLPSAQSGAQPQRLTLTPQFNNYVVSAGSARRSPHAFHDQKTFSDYGYRDQSSARSRVRSLQMRPSDGYGGSNDRSVDYYGGQSSRLSRTRVYDDYGGDDYELSPSTLRSSHNHHNHYHSGRSNSHGRHHSGSQTSRRRSASYRDGPSAGSRNNRIGGSDSIRDIMEQAMFDDDEPSSFEANEFTRDSVKGECCNEYVNKRYRHFALDDIPMTNPNLDELKDTTSGLGNTFESRGSGLQDRGKQSSAAYGDRQQQQLSSPDRDDIVLGDRDRDSTPTSRARYSNLSSVYYDRDLQNGAELKSSSRYATSSNEAGGGKRLYLDGRDLLDDDEWRFETIESVAHTAPQANAINSNTTITTTVPPNVAKVAL